MADEMKAICEDRPASRAWASAPRSSALALTPTRDAAAAAAGNAAMAIAFVVWTPAPHGGRPTI